MDIETSKIDNEFSKSDIVRMLNSRMPKGKTLFYLACQEGNYNLVKYLLFKNLNPSIKSRVRKILICHILQKIFKSND